MGDVIDKMPEQAIAFERFSKRVSDFMLHGVDEVHEAKHVSLLKTLLDFEFDEDIVPEAVWR